MCGMRTHFAQAVGHQVGSGELGLGDEGVSVTLHDLDVVRRGFDRL